MKDVYARDYAQLRDAIRDGSDYVLAHRLAYYASNFASITPLNQAVTLGFYDTPDTDTDTVYTTLLFSAAMHAHLLTGVI